MLRYFTSISYSGKPVQDVQSFVYDLYKKYDVDQDGFLNYEETRPFFEDLVKHRTDLGLVIEGHEEWFRSIDIDNDGVISRHEMLNYFISINYAGGLNKLNLQAYVEYLWTQYDVDRDGYLVIQETRPFFEELMRHRPDLELTTAKHLEWFRSIDLDGDGVITKPEMMNYFTQINYSGKPIQIIQAFVDELWLKYDTDKDGYLTHVETLPFFNDLVRFRTDLGLTLDKHD